MRRHRSNKRASVRSFKHRAGRTKRRNVARPLRGGLRI